MNMSDISIIYKNHSHTLENLEFNEPEYFADLYLDQIIDHITERWNEYNLKPFFYFPLQSIDEIHYRQNVFGDLENEQTYKQINEFARQMQIVKDYLKKVDEFYYSQQKEIWFLYATEVYCNAVKNFNDELSSLPLKSEGLNKVKDYLIEYCTKEYFISLENKIKNIKAELAEVKYQIIIQEGKFTVQPYETGVDYSKEIKKEFEKFNSCKQNNQNGIKAYKSDDKSSANRMNHIDAKILEFVSNIYPNVFSDLQNFYSTYGKRIDAENSLPSFVDETIAKFDREIHFYISYIEHIKKFQQTGLKFCYPVISNPSKEIYNYDGFDLALAQKLHYEKEQIVCNDFYLKDRETIIIVTGPNQGGKTIFARMFGQLHYLASIGCPVPGSKAKLYLQDNIYTQFERVEKVENLRGKLENDLTRIYSVLSKATSQSIIIMNEIFNSTTLNDMTFLSSKVLEKIMEIDVICVWVTFVDELTNYNGKIVSMTSVTDPKNTAIRTYKILRRSADGLAYAMAIAEKHRLKYDDIKERIKQ